jgi:hypothetical protein
MTIALGYGCPIPTLWIWCMPEAGLDESCPRIRFRFLSLRQTSPEFSEHKWLQLPAQAAR